MSEGLDSGSAAEEPSAERLAEQFRDGDGAAFDKLILRYQGRIFNMVYRMLGNYEDAADLTQEVFVKVYRAIGGFRGDSSFSTWLYAVAANMCRNRRRGLRRIRLWEPASLDDPVHTETGTVSAATASAAPSPREMAERQDVRRVLERCLAELPADFAMVVVMRDVQDMSYEEIAAALNCSMGTVKSRLSRGRLMVSGKMRKLL